MLTKYLHSITPIRSNMPVIPFVRLYEDAYPPTVHLKHDAGMDFKCRWHTEIQPFSEKVIGTGVTVEIPEGFVGILKPKSRDTFLVGAGVIEWTYVGELKFRLFNTSPEPILFRRGDYLGQMIIVSNLEPEPVEVDPEVIHQRHTDRGASGGINEV